MDSWASIAVPAVLALLMLVAGSFALALGIRRRQRAAIGIGVVGVLVAALLVVPIGMALVAGVAAS